MAVQNGRAAAAVDPPPLHPADFFEAVSDRDCVVELVLPPPEPAGRGRGKRARQEQNAVSCDAASQLLKSASPKFRCSG